MAAGDEIEKASGNILQQLLGPLATQIGNALADIPLLKRAQLNNQFKTLSNAKKKYEAEGFKAKDINVKVLVPLLEGISLEGDEEIQDMWANLLVNYIDADKNLTQNVYPNILKELSSSEIKILKPMAESNAILKTVIEDGNTTIVFIDPYAEKQEDFLQSNHRAEEVDNLERLGLIKMAQGGIGYIVGNDRYYLSHLGEAFVKACSR